MTKLNRLINKNSENVQPLLRDQEKNILFYLLLLLNRRFHC